MQVDVIVLLRRTTQAIAAWHYAIDKNGQFFTLDEQGNRQFPKTSWEQLALKINRLACNDSHTPVDVFLFLRDHLAESLYGYGQLEKIMNDARDHAWGGNIYVVWDQKTDADFDILYQRNETMLEECFRMLGQTCVTDLIEIPKKVRVKEPDEHKILRTLAVESENRRRNLRKIVGKEEWGWVLPDEACPLEAFLKRLVRTGLLPTDGRNQAIFYDRKTRRDLTRLLEKSRRDNRGGDRFVAAVKGIDEKILEELWKKELLILPTLYFNGTFEWLYNLIRLNQTSRPSAQTRTANSSQNYIETVEPSDRQRFQSEPNDIDLRLLVTSAFHPREPYHCLGAAKEIGALLRDLPFHVDVQSHPYITCEQLPDLLEDGPFTAWLHLSHGGRKAGLFEAQTGRFALPERWLTCFNNYQGSLQLVLISACESATIAKQFAASGARVAIGFEGKVMPVAAKLLTKIVVPAALQAGDRQSAILDAFRKACGDLSSRTNEERGYIDARPKAFKLLPKSS